MLEVVVKFLVYSSIITASVFSNKNLFTGTFFLNYQCVCFDRSGLTVQLEKGLNCF